MRIYLMTDMEGVCGVLDRDDWVLPSSRYFQTGRRLLTLEANAAIDGFYSAGATSVLVVDGFEAGGIDQESLDRRTLLLRSPTGAFPFGLDRGFDAMAWVGQHAKAGSAHAHLPHTDGYRVRDYRINDVSVGEFGRMAMCGTFLGVPAIFASGDEALCREAKELIPGIETASVKRGLASGDGDELDRDAYGGFGVSALHLHPEKARETIKNGAAAALARLRQDRKAFPLVPLSTPFLRQVSYRREGEKHGYTATARHPTDLIAMLNSPETKRRT